MINNEAYQTLSAVCLKAIGDAEIKTSAEIVPIMSKASDDYVVANYRLALLGSLTGGTLGYFFESFFETPVSWTIYGMGTGMIVGFFLAYIPTLKALFITKEEGREESLQRAIQLFYQKNLHSLPERNALLIYVSEIEQQIHLLADVALKEKIEQKEWDQAIVKMSAHFKYRRYTQGWLEGINTCAEILMQHYPAKMTSRGSGNSFSNELRRE